MSSFVRIDLVQVDFVRMIMLVILQSGAYRAPALLETRRPALEARWEGTAIQGALLHELSAQNTLDGGPAKDSGFFDSFIVSAGDVLDECGAGVSRTCRSFGSSGLRLGAAG
jgi:hypothetical protein